MPKGVYQHHLASKETRKLMSLVKLGHEVSEETRRKISESQKGKKLSIEHKNKLSLIHKGKKLSEKTKSKISQKLKGRICSKKTKKRMSKSRIGIKLSEKTKKKLSEINKGKILSREIRKKISESMKGERSLLWKGGITPLTIQIRGCFKYRQWRSDIFTRDNFTCQECGIRGGKINADHYPKSFSDIFHENKIKSFEQAMDCEEFWNINNGRTLCKKCHKLTNNYLNNNRKNNEKS